MKTEHAAVRGWAFTFAAFAVFALALTLLATLAHAILSKIRVILDRPSIAKKTGRTCK